MIISRVETDSTPGERVVVFSCENGDFSFVCVWREKYISGLRNKRTEDQYLKEVAMPYFESGQRELVAR